MTDQSIFASQEAAGGRNVPDYAAEESERLRLEYDSLDREVSEVLDEARALPKEVEDEETANLYTTVITRMTDLDKKIEGFRQAEGTQWLRKKTACDSFFFGFAERIFRRKKTDNAGGADILQARLHAYNEKRRLEEQRRRDEEARIAREAEEKARREREALEREQREAEERAARARKAANKEAAEKAAREAEEAAARVREQEELARAQRQETEAAARAKPADMVRERHAGGAMNTMKMVWHVEIEDSMALDPVALWPFVHEDAKLKALRAWSKTTQYRKPMKGAIIEERAETVVRR